MRISPGPLPRTIAELDDPAVLADRVLRVASARVVFADHDLLQRDFPALGDASLTGDAEREAWLLAHAGVISEAQLRSDVANSPIAVEGDVRAAWRPSRYGRAVVVEANDPANGPCGLLDVKGAGVAPWRTPSAEMHSSGLCSLREVLRELLFQTLIDEIFHRAAPAFWTVPVYGVIDLGFDVKTRDGGAVPAGMLVRRAHRRPPHGRELPHLGSLEQRTKLEIELLLRHYGLTSSNRGTRYRFENVDGELWVSYGNRRVTYLSQKNLRELEERFERDALPLECDAVNVQLTREVENASGTRAHLVDFGHYEVRSRFDDPLVSLVYGELLQWGGAIRPGDAGFVQPRPALCVPHDRWGFPQRAQDAARPRRSEGEGPSVLAQELAYGFRRGTLSGEQVRSAVDAHVSESIAHW